MTSLFLECFGLWDWMNFVGFRFQFLRGFDQADRTKIKAASFGADG
jgi:hypothetical protein